MATSGQEQVLESLPPRPSHEWTEEDVASFFEAMRLRDSVPENFKRKHSIVNLLQSMQLTAFSQGRTSMERIFYRVIGLKLICLNGIGKIFHQKKNGE